MTRQPDAGFTLIESLIALAVLAMTAVALLGATEAHIARIGALETRAAAGWATQNYLAELTLGTDPTPSPAPILGIAFRIAEAREPTTDPELVQITLTAQVAGTSQAFGRLTGFLDIGAAP